MTQPLPAPISRYFLLPVALLLILLLPPVAAGPTENATGGPLLAVIPTLGIGGPLAILALLFPSLFGGVLVLFRQWGAFFTVLSINSMILLLHWWFAPALAEAGTWWASQTALWLVLTAVNLLGVLWAWRRTVKAFEPGQMRLEAPVRTELLVLGLLSVCCVLVAVSYVLFPPPVLSPMWALTFVLSVGIWAGALYRVTCVLRDRATGTFRLHLPTEAVMLWAMLVPAVALFSWQTASGGDTSEVVESSEGQPAAQFVKARTLNPNWRHNFGMVLSTPLLDGGRLYVAAAHTQPGFSSGAVYCIDARSGKTFWAFDDGGQMKQVFSSPRLADGRVYIGEGFHDDPNCQLYCLDALTGKKLWAFPTDSQTESSPCLAGGKVYFGAGNAGVYALDTHTGKKLWRYGQEPGKAPLFRVGASPVVAASRLFVGSGMDRNNPDQCETAVVCLNGTTGKEIWKVKTDLPSWAEPVVAGAQVFFALGNGDIETNAPTPAGQVLCLDTATGREVWRFQVANSVLSRPAVDGQHIYFGSRDGHCYCLGRFDGKLRWKKAMGSPVVAGPALDQGDLTGRALNVFVVSAAGRLSCLDASSGKAHWTARDLEPFGAFVTSSPQLEITPGVRGIRRRIFLGTALYSRTNPAVYRFEDLLPARNQEP